ncbi:glutamate racemase [Pseudoduganella sp. OTU4001]|uniref:glutamate racemase n=1 Tax=Pseudoduganella sp. OTU4001 TaxID=3043854 RepID=UPI00313A9E19
MTHAVPSSADAPIGVFDSGVGGLSVLRHIHAQLPHEHVLYFADSAFAPYGAKTDEWLVQRALDVTAFLISRGAKALVVACNTATVAAIKAVRTAYPALPVVGVEPGLKPGAAATRNGTVGVLATASTLRGEKFLALREQISSANGTRFLLQPCGGLVERIEQGDLSGAETAAMLEGFVTPLLDQGADTLVLGCTHYPFVREAIASLVAERGDSAAVTLIDTGDAVARQLARLLEGAGLQRPGGTPAHLRGYTSGNAAALEQQFANLLGLHPQVESVQV